MIPAEFDYLRAAALKWGVDEVRVVRTGSDVADRLSREDQAALAAVYDECRLRNATVPINNWIDAHPDDPERVRLWLLLVLFQQLGERGIAPFSDGSVRNLPRKWVLDWSILPADLRYLAKPAEDYGFIQFEEDVEAFVNGATQADRNRLAALVGPVTRDLEKIERWIDEMNMVRHREAANVHFLLVLMNALDLM
jgi:hypothetical protein